MKTIRTLIGCLALALLLGGAAAAQEKPKPADEGKSPVPLKIVVVLSEFDGEKKISSMPYTLSAAAADVRSRSETARLRMGLKVPIQTATKEGQSQIQYMDVGTNLDARVGAEPDGRFSVFMVVQRSSVHTLEGATVRTGEFSGRPVLREFSSNFEFFVRDGQTFQSIVATDPVSGHVLKVDVTLNVMK